VRALRIYEGTTEIQRLTIAGSCFVPVEHAVVVGICECIGNFSGDLDGVLERELSLARQPLAQ
jgi:hypothetical protein